MADPARLCSRLASPLLPFFTTFNSYLLDTPPVHPLSRAVDPPRISVSQSCANPASCPILLSSGLNTNVKFTLSEPIVCDVGVTAECNVVVLLTNSNPNKVQISPCYVKWTSSDWFTAKTVNIKALNDPNNPLLNTDIITITTAPATSPAAFYTNFNANDLLIKAANLPSSQCRATGDPHYTVGGASHVFLVFLSPFFIYLL